ncbi:hypothetical protein ACEPAI_6911 [Sanghuangporus weigelae]
MQPAINTLPDELLREIFKYCLPEHPNFRSEFAPLLLTHVCRRWRAVGSETPELWTTLHLNNPALRRKNVLPLLDLWLQRSGSWPLDIDVDISILDGVVRNLNLGDYRRKQNVYRTLMAVIIPHKRRIHSLQGTLPMSIATDLGFDEMMSLEVLDLVGISEMTASSQPLALDLPEQLPKLTVLSLENVGLIQQSLYRQHQLSRLELSEMRNPFWMNCGTAVEILRQLPNLHTAYIGLNRPNDLALPLMTTRLEVPKLRFLYVSWDSWDTELDARPFFDSICAPKLKRLALRGGAETQTGIWDVLLRFIEASGHPPLTHLAIGDMGATDPCLLEVLRATPTLTHLTVNHALVTPPVLRALVWDPQRGDSQLVPRLKSIRLGGCEDFEDADIIPVLESRVSRSGRLLEGVSQLEEVVLRQCAGLRPENEKYIRRLSIPRVILDSNETLISPFGGLLDFIRVVEGHRDFFAK